jgi:hypothetical protein
MARNQAFFAEANPGFAHVLAGKAVPHLVPGAMQQNRQYFNTHAPGPHGHVPVFVPCAPDRHLAAATHMRAATTLMDVATHAHMGPASPLRSSGLHASPSLPCGQNCSTQTQRTCMDDVSQWTSSSVSGQNGQNGQNTLTTEQRRRERSRLVCLS